MATPTQLTTTISDLPTIQRLYAEDYKDAPKWFTSQFITTMNQFMQPVYSILNQGLDIMQNTLQEIYLFTLSNASATGSSNTMNFTPRKFIGAPHGVVIAQCYDATAAVPTAIGNPVTLDWYYSGGQIKILAIYGLTATHTYNFTLLIF